MQYKNDNTTFHRSFAVSVALALKFDVTGVLNCEKLIDNFACLKAWKKLCDKSSLLDMLVANIWYLVMQIIIYLPHLHGYNCLYLWVLPAGTEFMGGQGGHVPSQLLDIFCPLQHFVKKSNVFVQISWLHYCWKCFPSIKSGNKWKKWALTLDYLWTQCADFPCKLNSHDCQKWC